MKTTITYKKPTRKGLKKKGKFHVVFHSPLTYYKSYLVYSFNCRKTAMKFEPEYRPYQAITYSLGF